MSELNAGVARVNISPPVGIPMVGFAGRGPAEGLHDDLFATALALQAGDTRVLILSLDLIGVGEALTGEVQGEIERRTRTPAPNVLLCCSHTHYGPVTGSYETDLPPDVAAYVADLKFKLAGAAQVAFAQLEPVHIGAGSGESRIGINRREKRPGGEIVLGQNPDGPCDREVRVVRLDTAAGRPLAALVNFACHPVSAASQMRQISAGYVGTMRRLVEQFTGATCLFLQGAAGNINPVEMRHSLEPARRLGVMLGGEAAKVFEESRPAPAAGLAAESRRIELSAMTFPSVEAGEREVEQLRQGLERQRAGGAGEGSIYWAENRLRNAERRLESLRTNKPLPTIPATMSAVRFGPVALATAPGEIFTETGMEVKRLSPVAQTCFAGYTNGSIGYVPVPEAYAEGGYEVEFACRVGPTSAGMIRDAALELLASVRAAD